MLKKKVVNNFLGWKTLGVPRIFELYVCLLNNYSQGCRQNVLSVRNFFREWKHLSTPYVCRWWLLSVIIMFSYSKIYYPKVNVKSKVFDQKSSLTWLLLVRKAKTFINWREKICWKKSGEQFFATQRWKQKSGDNLTNVVELYCDRNCKESSR